MKEKFILEVDEVEEEIETNRLDFTKAGIAQLVTLVIGLNIKNRALATLEHTAELASFTRDALDSLVEYGRGSMEERGFIPTLRNLPSEIWDLTKTDHVSWDVRNWPRD